MDNIKIKKCLKSYLTAKKYYDSDIEKSYDYFKQCVKILNDLKDKNKLNEEYQDIIEETESECNKYLVMAIEATLDKPSTKKNKIDESQDNALFEIIEPISSVTLYDLANTTDFSTLQLVICSISVVLSL